MAKMICLLLLSSPLFSGEFDYGVELKAHHRNSYSWEMKLPFPFAAIPDFLAPGEEAGLLKTVDEGQHAEISRITFFAAYQFSPSFSARIKLDGIDKYDRNPTSSDGKLDLDEFWLQYGQDVFTDQLPEGSGIYLRLGKFGKFERQDDRNMESYGLLSTAFNRFEDAGLEFGADLGRHFYIKASYSNGNPVFFRDPNALAGDNGTPSRTPPVTEVPPLQSGILMFYDSEVEDYDFAEPETGIGLGFRFGDETGRWLVNGMAYHYSRKLQDSVDINGSFYGADLDLLNGVEEAGEALVGAIKILNPGSDLEADHFDDPLGINGRDKKEQGFNLWVYAGAFTFFGQYVASEIAGLDSSGYEAEVSYSIDLPTAWAIRSKPVLYYITPTIRYSELDNDWLPKTNAYPTPSVWWDWRKLDLGLNIGLYPGLKLTYEQQKTEFLKGNEWINNDESLITISWRWNANEKE